MHNRVINEAGKIWEYLKGFHTEGDSDIVVVCCSYDIRVCDYAVSLMDKIGAKKILFSGNTGNWTRDIWTDKEAHIFTNRAVELGVNYNRILIEDNATNIGENIKYSNELLLEDQKVTYVSKPNTLLRIKLTAPKHCKNSHFYTSGPDFIFPNDISNIVGLNGVINEMVGDIHRIIKYPKLGFQESHYLPPEILEAYFYLVDEGYTDHLLQL